MLSKIKYEITLNIKLESCKKAKHIHSDLRLKDIVNKKKIILEYHYQRFNISYIVFYSVCRKLIGCVLPWYVSSLSLKEYHIKWFSL